jgi:hypothetical protein
MREKALKWWRELDHKTKEYFAEKYKPEWTFAMVEASSSIIEKIYEHETNIDIYEVIKKLVGPITPVGASHVDSERLKNLKRLTELVERLVCDIDEIACNEDCHLHSVNVAMQHAKKFLDDNLGIEE